MKQHEALGLAFASSLKGPVQHTLLCIIYKSDFSTWEAKPMSVSYIRAGMSDCYSVATIERAFSQLAKLNIITRLETGRGDRVKSIKLNLDVLKAYAESTPQSEGIPQSDGIPQREGLNPSERGIITISITISIIISIRIALKLKRSKKLIGDNFGVLIIQLIQVSL